MTQTFDGKNGSLYHWSYVQTALSTFDNLLNTRLENIYLQDT